MPEADPAASAMSAVAEAVKGPDTPSSAAVKAAPDVAALWALVLAGPAISAMIIAAVWVLAYHFWPDAISLKALGLAADIVRAVAVIATVLALILGVVVFRLAAGSLKRVEAKAGPGSISIETGGT